MAIRESLLSGLSFGLTSGVITTLGLLVGLAAGTQSRLAVIGGVITIALADSMSDALGIHISEESKNRYNRVALWEATLATFAAKAVVSLSFLLPILYLPLDQAVWVSVGWGLTLVVLLSIWIARQNHEPPLYAVLEHGGIAILVVLATHALGLWVGRVFGG